MWALELLALDNRRFFSSVDWVFEECIRDFALTRDSPDDNGFRRPHVPSLTDDEAQCVRRSLDRLQRYRATYEDAFNTELKTYTESTEKLQRERLKKLTLAATDPTAASRALHSGEWPGVSRPAAPPPALDPDGKEEVKMYRPFGDILINGAQRPA